MNEHKNLVGNIKQCMSYVRAYKAQGLEAPQKLYLERAKHLMIDNGEILSKSNLDEFVKLNIEYNRLEQEVENKGDK